MITFEFHPWRPFKAIKDDSAIRRWLQIIGEASTEEFREGMSSVYPPASAPGAWPANRTFKLRGSIAYRVSGAQSVTVGTNTKYARFLRYGTSRMARRKMSDTALRAGIAVGRGRLGRWVKWVHA